MRILERFSLFACSSLLGGCFSAAVRYGEGWNGNSSPAGYKVAAGAADMATLPLQAPFLVASGAGAASRSHGTRVKNRKLDEIRNEPEIIFIQKLHKSRSDGARMAVYEALWDPNTPFTDTQLRRLYAEMDWRRVYVLSHPNCSLEFLADIKRSLPSLSIPERTQLLEHLSRNPATPTDWLREWADDSSCYGYGSQYARSWLKVRSEASGKY